MTTEQTNAAVKYATMRGKLERVERELASLRVQLRVNCNVRQVASDLDFAAMTLRHIAHEVHGI